LLKHNVIHRQALLRATITKVLQGYN